ncbi:bifunctional phosphoribosyl-AMP cyclohydrolase/phosphoribosyl-ATP diphosphatase HisIE [Hyphobacterium sp.]|uniref:bifunctional phosphoribosyl-AMP cyclohydrolase/phosphoribosyl-ATP diphosphatase HisIE n=1 Tax=Hyphobacterium sp. TaxID=2004662 RepID=UPI003BA947F7
MIDIADIDFEKGGGLVPAIVQHALTGRVLMLGYMNAEAVEKTSREGLVTFYSRSKKRLWTKGETSGHTLALAGMDIDCDRDTLLVRAIPAGPVCHTGTATCFGDDVPDGVAMLAELERIIDSRRQSDRSESYVAKLNASGVRKIAQKVGEEGVETALAIVDEDDDALKGEAADLVFHLLVALRARGLSIFDVADVLRARHVQASS